MDPNETSFLFGSRNTTSTPPPRKKPSLKRSAQNTKLSVTDALDDAWNVHSESVSRFSSPVPAKFGQNRANGIPQDPTNRNANLARVEQRKSEKKPEKVYQDFMRRRETSMERTESLRPSLQHVSKVPISSTKPPAAESTNIRVLVKTIEEQRKEIDRLKQQPNLASTDEKRALEREWRHLGGAVYHGIIDLCDLVLLINPDNSNLVYRKRRDLVKRIHDSLVPPTAQFSPSYLLQGCTILSALLSSHREDLAVHFGRRSTEFAGVSHLESILEDGFEESILLDAEFSRQ